MSAADPGRFTESIDEALRLRPGLIIGAGKDLVDAPALVTASHLDRRPARRRPSAPGWQASSAI
ncbi:hypothetical protein [Amycolatopsis sp. MtRt-6]|uniref:hypothetical protein n=1 Tax=Amycolatopsis sp. MtRt-6 TaxID=2792782 RepID=UPI001A8F65F4|nr:hypothetical protein [Amycolatopsis sp. MtRt-6]